MTIGQIMTWGAVAISLMTSFAFSISLVMAYITHDTDNLKLLVGAVIAMAANTVQFWIGSSAGSARKTDLLAAAPPVTPGAAP